MEQVVFPVRVLGRLGIRRLIVTNVADGINRAFKPADSMVITDLINLLRANPLPGANMDALGVRFPDMSEAYNRHLRDLAAQAAASMGLQLQSGVYIAVSGPSYETPAEIELFRHCGADAVSMSTVPEVIAANHMAFSCRLPLGCRRAGTRHRNGAGFAEPTASPDCHAPRIG